MPARFSLTLEVLFEVCGASRKPRPPKVNVFDQASTTVWYGVSIAVFDYRVDSNQSRPVADWGGQRWREGTARHNTKGVSEPFWIQMVFLNRSEHKGCFWTVLNTKAWVWKPVCVSSPDQGPVTCFEASFCSSIYSKQVFSGDYGRRCRWKRQTALPTGNHSTTTLMMLAALLGEQPRQASLAQQRTRRYLVVSVADKRKPAQSVWQLCNHITVEISKQAC